MPTFAYTELVNDPLARIETTAFGAGSGEYDQDDLGKGVKMSGANTMVIVTAGDEIEGFIKSVEPSTVNDGYSYGSVQRSGRVIAEVGPNQVSTIALYGLIVADTHAAAGAAGIAEVKDGAPTTHLWRVIRILSGTGVAGDSVLLERV